MKPLPSFVQLEASPGSLTTRILRTLLHLGIRKHMATPLFSFRNQAGMLSRGRAA